MQYFSDGPSSASISKSFCIMFSSMLYKNMLKISFNEILSKYYEYTFGVELAMVRFYKVWYIFHAI